MEMYRISLLQPLSPPRPLLPSPLHAGALPERPAKTSPFGTMAAAPFGSSLILPISYAYVSMMGTAGLTEVGGCLPVDVTRPLSCPSSPFLCGPSSWCYPVLCAFPHTLLCPPPSPSATGLQARYPQGQLHGSTPVRGLPRESTRVGHPLSLVPP